MSTDDRSAGEQAEGKGDGGWGRSARRDAGSTAEGERGTGGEVAMGRARSAGSTSAVAGARRTGKKRKKKKKRARVGGGGRGDEEALGQLWGSLPRRVPGRRKKKGRASSVPGAIGSGRHREKGRERERRRGRDKKARERRQGRERRGPGAAPRLSRREGAGAGKRKGQRGGGTGERSAEDLRCQGWGPEKGQSLPQ